MTPPAPGAATAPAAPPGTLVALLAIARRAALESLRDRMTVLGSLVFAVAFPAVMVVAVVRPLAHSDAGPDVLGAVLAIYLMIAGITPSTAAVGSAAGQFAGERERGVLAPLLASPASNVAIFGGKLLGAVLPALLFSAIAEAVYLAVVAALTSPANLRLLPPALTLTMLALVPAMAIFAAAVASLISSRVRTYNAAQQLAGLALLPVWGLFFSLAFKLGDWGPAGLVAAVGTLALADVALTVLAAATWRREEVLAQR